MAYMNDIREVTKLYTALYELERKRFLTKSSLQAAREHTRMESLGDEMLPTAQGTAAVFNYISLRASASGTIESDGYEVRIVDEVRMIDEDSCRWKATPTKKTLSDDNFKLLSPRSFIRTKRVAIIDSRTRSMILY